METRKAGKKRLSSSSFGLQDQVASKRVRSKPSHTATSVISSNDSVMNLNMDNVVNNISTSIMTKIKESVCREVREHLNTVGLTGYQPVQSQMNNTTTTATAITSQAATDTTAFSLNLDTPQNCAVSTLNIPTTGMITRIIATNVSSHNTVTSSLPDSLFSPQPAPTSVTVSGISSTSTSGNELSLLALSFDITRINSQGMNTHSFTSVSIPLHATVSQKIKEKIWSNEFVDLATVFDQDIRFPSDISLNFNSSGASVITNPLRRFISIEQWTDVFAKYASVVRVKYPESAEALAKYSDTVRSIAKSNGNWHYYDTQFLKLRQATDMPWDLIQHELYFRSLNQKQSFRKRQDFPNSSPPIAPRKFCFKFNKGDHCARCSFQHACSFCGGNNHPVFRCFKLGRSEQGARVQQTQSGRGQHSGSIQSNSTVTNNFE